MSESRHDSPFANSGLVMTIEPADTGSQHPLAGVHYQQRVERLAYLKGTVTTPHRIQWATTSWPAGRAKGTLLTATPGGPARLRAGRVLPAEVSAALQRGLPIMDRRFGGLFLPARLTGPESRGSSPVPDPPRRAHPPEPRRPRTLPLRRRRRLRGRHHQRSRRRAPHRTRARGELRTADLVGSGKPTEVPPGPGRWWIAHTPHETSTLFSAHDSALAAAAASALAFLAAALVARRSALAALAAAGVVLAVGNRSLSRTALPERSRR